MLTRCAVRKPLHDAEGYGVHCGDWLELSQQGPAMVIRSQSCVKDLLFLKGCFLARPYLVEKHYNEVHQIKWELLVLNSSEEEFRPPSFPK